MLNTKNSYFISNRPINKIILNRYKEIINGEDSPEMKVESFPLLIMITLLLNEVDLIVIDSSIFIDPFLILLILPNPSLI